MAFHNRMKIEVVENLQLFVAETCRIYFQWGYSALLEELCYDVYFPKDDRENGSIRYPSLLIFIREKCQQLLHELGSSLFDCVKLLDELNSVGTLFQYLSEYRGILRNVGTFKGLKQYLSHHLSIFIARLSQLFKPIYSYFLESFLSSSLLYFFIVFPS
jgi:hypothetical protein